MRPRSQWLAAQVASGRSGDMVERWVAVNRLSGRSTIGGAGSERAGGGDWEEKEEDVG